MKTQCLTLEEFLNHSGPLNPHLEICEKCRSTYALVQKIKAVTTWEKQSLHDFLKIVQSDNHAGTIFEQVIECIPSRRWKWIESNRAASPALALKLATMARSTLYRSPVEAREWLSLAQQTFNFYCSHQEKDETSKSRWDNGWISGRLKTIEGSLHVMQGQIQEALESYEQALIIFNDLDDRYQAALLAEGFAVTLTKLGRVDEARRRCLQMLPVLRSYGARRYYLRLISNLASVLLAMRKVQRALTLSEKLIHVEDMDDEFRVMALGNHGVNLLRADRLDEAEVYIRRSLALTQSLSMDLEVARNTMLLGLVAMHRHDYTAAFPFIMKSRKIFFQEIDLLDTALCDTFIARIYLKTGRGKESLQALSFSLDFFTKEKILPDLKRALALWEEAQRAQKPDVEALADRAHRFINVYAGIAPAGRVAVR